MGKNRLQLNLHALKFERLTGAHLSNSRNCTEGSGQWVSSTLRKPSAACFCRGNFVGKFVRPFLATMSFRSVWLYITDYGRFNGSKTSVGSRTSKRRRFEALELLTTLAKS